MPIYANVRIMRKAPFDDTYSDTINFGSVGAQAGFMAGITKYTFSNISYQRVNSAVSEARPPLTIRLPRVADDLYDCNYIGFQNGAGKWFYAFIKQVNYINDGNTEIVYQLDHYQTWIKDFTIYPSIVEREHVVSDLPNFYTEPEPVGVDYYVTMSRMQVFETTSYINMGCTYSDKLPAKFKKGGKGSNIYSGLWYYTSTSTDDISATIMELDVLGIGNSIVSIFMSPSPVNVDNSGVSVATGIQKAGTVFPNNYVAKNKKMCSFPYRFARVVSSDGESVDLKPQLFNHDSLQLTKYLTSNETPVISLTPAYDGLGDNFQYTIEYKECPQCAWGSSVYANWSAQNITGNAFKVIKGALGIGMALTTGNPLPALTGGNTLIDLVSQASYQKAQPDNPRGSSISYGTNYALNRIGFEIFEYATNYDCARRIDDYFDMFGYAINLLKVPEMNSRPNWNYVKTKSVILKGSLPVEAMARIKQMFNDGVRFWHTGDVGNFSLSNRPIGEE